MSENVVDALGEIIYCTYCSLPVKDYDQGLPLAMMNKIQDLSKNGSTKEEILDYFRNLYGPSSVNDGINFYVGRLSNGFYDTYPIIILSVLAILSLFLIVFYAFKFKKNQEISL
jgi:hypothetical protein